jgi:quercetin dioxygenase-like cupin family protein
MTRRVVTGHDADGRAVFLSDGTPPNTVATPDGIAVSEVLRLDGPPRTAADGQEERAGAFELEPPPGGASLLIITVPPAPDDAPDEERWIRVEGEDPARPGMHATDTLDVMVVLDGEIVLGLDDGEHRLAQGDCVVQRGNEHRWRVVGDRPCTYAVALLRPDPSAPEPAAVATATAGGSGSWRRLVAGTDDGRRSCAVVDGPAPVVYEPGAGGVSLVELWQTGGPLREPGQGGDPVGGWELEPRNHGIAFRAIEMPAGVDSGDAGWHTTDTIDVDVMISGQIELALPDVEPVVLGHGDAVVQRGTHHKWTPVGDEPVRYVALMIALAR